MKGENGANERASRGRGNLVPEKVSVALNVNGAAAHRHLAPWTTLLDALRHNSI
jgi:hypothetical protein